MRYFAGLKERIRKATTGRQVEAIAEKLRAAESELAELRSELATCRHECSCKERAKGKPKFVIFDKYTSQVLGMAKTDRVPKGYPDEARTMTTARWLKEGNSL